MNRLRLGVRVCALSLALQALGAPTGIAAAPTRTDDAQAVSSPRYEVGEMIVTFTDTSRRVWYRGVRYAVPRSLKTVIRYPATGNPARLDVFGAAPAIRNSCSRCRERRLAPPGAVELVSGKIGAATT